MKIKFGQYEILDVGGIVRASRIPPKADRDDPTTEHGTRVWVTLMAQEARVIIQPEKNGNPGGATQMKVNMRLKLEGPEAEIFWEKYSAFVDEQGMEL